MSVRHSGLLGLALALAVAAPATPADGGADTSPMSASSTFGLLKLQVVKRPDTAEWRATLQAAALAPWSGHGSMWRLGAPDGEVRAEAIFRERETSIHLLFFPTSKTPLAEATLAWMYRSAAGYSFEDGDGVELMFPEEPITNGTGFQRQSFLVSLTSGALRRSVVIMRWK